MTYQEFAQRELELQGMIAHYQADSHQKEIEIALNNKAIVDLRFQIKKLHNEYAESTYNKEQEAA